MQRPIRKCIARILFYHMGPNAVAKWLRIPTSTAQLWQTNPKKTNYRARILATPVTINDETRVLHDWLGKMSDGRLAKAADMSKSTIGHWRRQLNISPSVKVSRKQYPQPRRELSFDDENMSKDDARRVLRMEQDWLG